MKKNGENREKCAGVSRRRGSAGEPRGDEGGEERGEEDGAELGVRRGGYARRVARAPSDCGGCRGRGRGRAASVRRDPRGARGVAISSRCVESRSEMGCGQAPCFSLPGRGGLAAENQDVACLTKKVLDKARRCVHNTAALLLTQKERWLSWSKALDSKSSVVEISPWVRIPLSPLTAPEVFEASGAFLRARCLAPGGGNLLCAK